MEITILVGIIFLFAVLVCLFMVLMFFLRDEDPEQSELHAKTRYETTASLEEEI